MREEAEKRIRESVPELQELKEGCKVINKDIRDKNEYLIEKQDCVFTINELYVEDSGDKFIAFDKIVTDYETAGGWYSESVREKDFLRFYEALGSEIHLEHILKALKYTDYVISVDGYIQEMIQAGGYSEYQDLETIAMYDLDKPFTEQSEEFYKFLVEILK